MANINKIRLSGTTYNIVDLNATKTVELTQAQYDALSQKDPNTFYIITDAQSGDLSNYYTKSEVDTALSGKQNVLTIDSTVTSGSTNPVSGGAVYSKLDGLSLLKLTQSQYDALSPNYDSNTLYVIVN